MPPRKKTTEDTNIEPEAGSDEMKSDSSNEPTEVDNNDLNSEASVSSEEASGQLFFSTDGAEPAKVDENPYLRKKLFFNNKILFLIRDPLSTLFSYSKKENLKLNYNLNHLKRFVNFYNSYAEFILKKETCLIFSEDLINNGFLTFKKILSYLNNGKKFGKIDDNILKESIEFFNFSNELKRSDKHSKTYYFEGLGNYHNKYTLNEK